MKYYGNRKIKSFSCLNQFLCITFVQLADRKNSQDIQQQRSRKNQ
ncbi:DUF4372 domain-containing protein [bacterium]|nr:DUF4372 domain-containing protein [bacterium]